MVARRSSRIEAAAIRMIRNMAAAAAGGMGKESAVRHEI
jgi:hypothetical protein